MEAVNLLPRRGRPPKAHDTLSELLARPLPVGVAKIRAELADALAAFEHAKRAMDNAMSADTAGRLEAAESKLRRLEVSADVAGPLGSSAPSAAEIEAAEREVSAARAAHESRGERAALYREAIEERRRTLDEVHSRLTAALVNWRAPILEAIENELADVAHRANEALATLKAVDPTRPTSPRLRLPKVSPEHPADFHDGPDSVTLSEPFASAITDWQRAQRALLRI